MATEAPKKGVPVLLGLDGRGETFSFLMRTNRRAYVIPRQLAMYIARQLTGASLEEIGFGDRHHTTVLYAINKIEAIRRSDEKLNSAITRLMDTLVAQS